MSLICNDINEYISYLFDQYISESQEKPLPTEKNFLFTLEEIENLINTTYEETTGCTLYNKSDILRQYKNDLSMEKLTQELLSNTICEIDFSEIFKSKMGFQLFFRNDDIYIMYKNKIIQIPDELSYICNQQKKPIKNCWDFMYTYTLCNIIKSLHKKDLTVRYHCKNIPPPYWELFKIKCNKVDQPNTINQKLESIINGSNYKKPLIIIPDISQETEEVLSSSEEYNYRMELMAYLDDTEMENFLNLLETHDSKYKTLKLNDMQFLKSYLLFLVDKINQQENKLVKYYLLFLFMKYYNLNHQLVNQSEFTQVNNTFRGKLINFKDGLAVIEAMGITFSKAFAMQYNICITSL